MFKEGAEVAIPSLSGHSFGYPVEWLINAHRMPESQSLRYQVTPSDPFQGIIPKKKIHASQSLRYQVTPSDGC